MSNKSIDTKEGEGEQQPGTDAKEIDVLFGRGSVLLFHPGNVKYRNVVKEHRPVYSAAPRDSKKIVAARVVEAIRKTGARFLKRTEDGEDVWMEVCANDVMEKVKQSLREKQKIGSATSDSGRKRKAQEPLPSPEGKPSAEARSKAPRSTPKPENTTRFRSDSSTALLGQLAESMQPAELTRRSTAPSNLPGPNTISDILHSSMAQPVAPPSPWLHTNTTLPSSTNLLPPTVTQLLLQHPPSPTTSTVALQQLLAANAAGPVAAIQHHYNTSTSSSLRLLQSLQSPTRLLRPLSHELQVVSSMSTTTPNITREERTSNRLHSQDDAARTDRSFDPMSARRLPLSRRSRGTAAAAARAGEVTAAESPQPTPTPLLPAIDMQRQRQLQRYIQRESSVLSAASYLGSDEDKQSTELFAGRPTDTLGPIHRRQQETFQQVLNNLRDNTKEGEKDSSP